MSISTNHQVAAFQSFWNAQDRQGVPTSSEARGVDGFRAQQMQEQVAIQSAQSMMSSLGEWATNTLGSLFGGSQPAEGTQQAPPASPAPSNESLAIDKLKATGNNLLGVGSAGPEVEALQEMLKSAGYDLGEAGVDGKFGPKTKAAVEAFQKDQAAKADDPEQGLAVDGIVGANTRAALGNDALSKAKADTVMDNHAERNAAPTPSTQSKVDSVMDKHAERNAAPSAKDTSAKSGSDAKSGGGSKSGGDTKGGGGGTMA